MPASPFTLRWEQADEDHWYGRCDAIALVREIEHDTLMGQFFVDGCRRTYTTLKAAKCAAARTQPGWVSDANAPAG